MEPAAVSEPVDERLDWEDLRFFRTIAQHGSVRGAAQNLGVNASTVTRRLDHLERALGTHLFTRSPGGLHITTAGVEVATLADEAARAIGRVASSLKGRDQQLAGTLRVAIPEFLAGSLLTAELAGFAMLYPAIEIAVLADVGAQELTTGEVDVALIDTDTPPPSMIGRRVTAVGLAAYVDDAPVADSSAWVEWARPGVMGARCRELRERYFPTVEVRFQCDRVPSQVVALRSGVGAGMLPCVVGDADSGLRRLDAMAPQEGPELWLLSHPDLRSARRVQVLLEYLREVFADQASAFAGI